MNLTLFLRRTEEHFELIRTEKWRNGNDVFFCFFWLGSYYRFLLLKFFLLNNAGPKNFCVGNWTWQQHLQKNCQDDLSPDSRTAINVTRGTPKWMVYNGKPSPFQLPRWGRSHSFCKRTNPPILQNGFSFTTKWQCSSNALQNGCAQPPPGLSKLWENLVNMFF